MFATLIQKELRAIILSPKFIATFLVSAMLLLLSVFVGIREYEASVDQYNTGVQLAQQRMDQATGWHGVFDKAYRAPNPMTIFSSGINYDVGRWSEIGRRGSVSIRNSVYSDDPIFAVFRILDFAFIVQVVFSLMAILFTFNAVNGERESGTLRLVLSNAVSRAGYILAKCIGSWLGLVVPVMVTVSLALGLVLVFGVPLDGGHWLRIAVLIALSILYMSLFIVLGVFLSSLTRESSVSFLIALVVWVSFVLIIPSAGIAAAGQLIDVPRQAEIQGQRDAFAKDEWQQYYAGAEERFREERAELEGDEKLDEDAMWGRMMFEDSVRGGVRKKIEAYESRLMEDLDNRMAGQRSLGLTLSRFSPASAYQLACMTLAETDLALKARYDDVLKQYREDFVAWAERKQSESGNVGGMMIEMDSEKGLTIGSGREEKLDLSDRPRFTAPRQQSAAVLQSVTMDFGLLSILTILSFAGAFVAFLRYDVR